MQLNNARILLTGATGGLGQALAAQLADAGDIPYNQRLGWSVEENIPGEYDLFGNRWRSPEESL